MKSNKLLIAVLALVLPFILSVACGSSGPPSIGEVVTAKSLDENYKPIDVTSSYQPEDTFYHSVQVKNLAAGSIVKIQYKLDGETYKESTVTAEEGGSGYYGFILESASGHVPGNYTAEVYLDDVLAKTISFTVEGNTQSEILDVVLAESLDSEFKPVNPTTIYKPNDTITVSVKVKNVKTGLEIKLIYTFGDQTEEQTITTTAMAGEGNFGFELNPPASGYPTGDFTVEAFLNGVSAGDPVNFTIVE
jgi:hypothetical protein